MVFSLKNTKLTHEVLVTFMTEVAAIMNARPLAPVSTVPDDLFILIPTSLSPTPLQHILGQMDEAVPFNTADLS